LEKFHTMEDELYARLSKITASSTTVSSNPTLRNLQDTINNLKDAKNFTERMHRATAIQSYRMETSRVLKEGKEGMVDKQGAEAAAAISEQSYEITISYRNNIITFFVPADQSLPYTIRVGEDVFKAWINDTLDVTRRLNSFSFRSQDQDFIDKATAYLRQMIDIKDHKV